MIDYYLEFLDTIHKKLDARVEILGIGQLGHGYTEMRYETARRITLQDQIASKLAFIDTLVAGGTSVDRIYLMGHSVGAWMCLEVSLQHR